MSSYSELQRLGLVFRPIDAWPGEATRNRRWSNFRASLSDTVSILALELRQLEAKQIVLQVALRDRDIRLDGFPRSDVRAEHPGVILAFESKFGPLKYATDSFSEWEDNLRAIALSMRSLRAVDRYGVSKRGEQYQGWKALTAGTDDTGIETLAQAQAFLDAHGGYREGVKKLHPDAGGDPDEFRKLVRAKEVAEAHVVYAG